MSLAERAAIPSLDDVTLGLSRVVDEIKRIMKDPHPDNITYAEGLIKALALIYNIKPTDVENAIFDEVRRDLDAEAAAQPTLDLP